jgi:hypothetical protein
MTSPLVTRSMTSCHVYLGMLLLKTCAHWQPRQSVFCISWQEFWWKLWSFCIPKFMQYFTLDTFLQLHNFIPSFETTVTLCTITIMNELLLFLLIYTQCQCNENLYRWDYCNCLWKKEVKYSSLQWSYPGWGYYWRLLLTLATDSLEWRHITISSGVASPKIWSCYANIPVFIDRENKRFLKKWIMIMMWYLHSMTKLSGWLRHWLSDMFSLCISGQYDFEWTSKPTWKWLEKDFLIWRSTRYSPKRTPRSAYW